MEEKLVEEFYKTLSRMHQCRPCFQKHGELSNVEFFILIEISVLLEEREGGITLGELIGSTGMTMSAASKKVSILENIRFRSRNKSTTCIISACRVNISVIIRLAEVDILVVIIYQRVVCTVIVCVIDDRLAVRWPRDRG